MIKAIIFISIFLTACGKSEVPMTDSRVSPLEDQATFEDGLSKDFGDYCKLKFSSSSSSYGSFTSSSSMSESCRSLLTEKSGRLYWKISADPQNLDQVEIQKISFNYPASTKNTKTFSSILSSDKPLDTFTDNGSFLPLGQSDDMWDDTTLVQIKGRWTSSAPLANPKFPLVTIELFLLY